VALTGCQVEGSEPIGVGAIDDLEHLVVLAELLLGKGEYPIDFIGVALVYLGPVVHLHLLHILLPLPLLAAFRRYLALLALSRDVIGVVPILPQGLLFLSPCDGILGSDCGITVLSLLVAAEA
jgi:hypothetical protein